MLFMIILVAPMTFLRKKIPQGFDKVKDLVRGTITTDLSELTLAYKNFIKTPGVRVVGIKENLEKLQNITINFVFRESFIGEMQFRFKDFPPNYHANHFIYEIERSRQKIEILESLNKEAVSLCKKGMLRTMDDSEASSKSDDEDRAKGLKPNGIKVTDSTSKIHPAIMAAGSSKDPIVQADVNPSIDDD